jgi:hypothetical protein
MEQFRNIRIVLAPFVLLGSLLLGAWVGCVLSLDDVEDLEPHVLAAIGGVLIASIPPVGFVIGAGASFLQWVAHFATTNRWDRFEVALPQQTWRTIWDQTGDPGEMKNKTNRLFVSALWIRTVMNERAFELADRRWQSANAHFNGCLAILSSYAVGPLLLGIPITLSWVAWTAPLACGMASLAFIARFELSKIVALLAHYPELRRAKE